MTTKMVLGKDINGNVTYQIPFSDTGYMTTLAVGVAQSITVPNPCNVAWFSFSSGTDVWVNATTSATLPGGGFASTTQDLNPVARGVTPGATLSFISAQIAYVKVAFYEQSGSYTGIG